MSSNLSKAMDEWALIAFTILMPTSVGMTLVGALTDHSQILSLATGGVGALGLLASIGHLARPLRAPFSILNWQHSWLSREILVAITHWLFVIGWCLAVYFKEPILARLFPLCALIIGIVLLHVIAQAYRVHSRPAWNGIETLIELYAEMLGLGISVGVLVLSLGFKFLPIPGWALVLCVGLGAAMDYWAQSHRMRRLTQMPPRENVMATLVRYKEIYAFSRNVVVFDCMALLFSLGLIFFPKIWMIFLILMVAAELIGHFFARFVFYTLPIQTRYAPQIHHSKMRSAERVQ